MSLFEYIDTMERATAALDRLKNAPIVSMDSEGVSLGRTGPLTLLALCAYSPTIQGQKAEKAFLFDVQVLGRQVFSLGLKALLESSSASKLCFDCREDSNALYHQFDVKLANVLDCQALDQACRLWKGEDGHRTLASRRPGWKKYLPKMSDACERYFSSVEMHELDVRGYSPHKTDANVWGKRPLSEASRRYAALDVHTINRLYFYMDMWNVCEELLTAARVRSAENVSKFRDFYRAIEYVRDKDFCAVEDQLIPSFKPTSHQRTAFADAMAKCKDEHMLLHFARADAEIDRLNSLPSSELKEAEVNAVAQMIQSVPAYQFSGMQSFSAKVLASNAILQTLRERLHAEQLELLNQALQAAKKVTEPSLVADVLAPLEKHVRALSLKRISNIRLAEAEKLMQDLKRLQDREMFKEVQGQMEVLRGHLRNKECCLTYFEVRTAWLALEHIRAKYPKDAIVAESKADLDNAISRAIKPFKQALENERSIIESKRINGLVAEDLTGLISAIAKAKSQLGLHKLDPTFLRDIRNMEALLEDARSQLVLEDQIEQACSASGDIPFSTSEMETLATKAKQWNMSSDNTKRFLALAGKDGDKEGVGYSVGPHSGASNGKDYSPYHDDYDNDNSDSREYVEDYISESPAQRDLEWCDIDCGYCGECGGQVYSD